MSARLGWGMSQNADIADIADDKMLTLLTLGTGGAEKLGLTEEIKRK